MSWAYPCVVANALEGSPPLLRSLLEAVAAHLEMDRGRWRAELIFEHGRLREVFRHEERIAADQLDERFPTSG